MKYNKIGDQGKSPVWTELGKWMFDIGKYIITVVILSTIFTNIDSGYWYLYLTALLLTFVALGLGIWLMNFGRKQ